MKRLFLVFAVMALGSTAFGQNKKDPGLESFLKRNTAAKAVHWKGQGKQMEVELKSGKREIYDLADRGQRATAIAKYGELPAAPPPPPKVAAPPPVPAEEIVPPPPPKAVKHKGTKS